VTLPPGLARFSTKPPRTGSETRTNTIGTERVYCCNGFNTDAPCANIASGGQAYQFRGVGRRAASVPAGPTIVDPHVAPLRPAQRAELMNEFRNQGLQDRFRPTTSARRSSAPDRAAARAPPMATQLSRRRERDELAAPHHGLNPVRANPGYCSGVRVRRRGGEAAARPDLTSEKDRDHGG
jgi:hypothetical protein